MISEEGLQQFLDLIVNEDYRGITDQFEENAIFSDPLFPKSPITGNTRIAKAFSQVLALAEASTFEITTFSATKQIAMAEVSTYHRYKGGFEAKYMQAFVLEFGATGKIQRANVYNDIRVRDIPSILASPLRNLFRSEPRE